MKQIVFLAGLALLAATSCSNESDNEVINNTPEVRNTDTLVSVHVHVNDFSIIQEDFPETRSNPQTPTASGVKAMTLAFYNGDTEVYKTTQLKDDATTHTTFGEFHLSLPLGSYTMVVLGYGYYDGDVLALSSPTQAVYTSDHARDTFSATQSVNITSTNDMELGATLSRIVTKFQINSSDNKTEEANNIRMTFSEGGKAFNPTTGLATANTGFSNTVGIGANVGAKSQSVSYLFLDSDEQKMNVTIETLDANGNVIKRSVVNNVSFKRNCITKLTGLIYTAGISSTFLFDTDWLEEFTGTF